MLTESNVIAIWSGEIPTIVLGHWEPPYPPQVHLTSTIAEAITNIINKSEPFKGLKNEFNEVRTPFHNNAIRAGDPIVNTWHRDDYFNNQAGRLIILWSIPVTSMILDLETKQRIDPKPGDIVLINNHRCVHRTPEENSPNRWFYRCIPPTPYPNNPTSISILPRWLGASTALQVKQ